MKLSIIIPVFNVEDYLADCLDSVLNQDIDDYEIVCVEDKSTDGSAHILRKYAKKYSNIKVIYHDCNRGLSAARNTGIRHAQGEYIQFVDSDDMIKLGTCRKLYENAKRNNADVVYFNMDFLNDDKKGLHRVQQEYSSFPGVYSGREIFCEYQKKNSSKPEAVRHFIKKNFLIENNLFFYEGIIHEDILFYFMVLMKARVVTDINKDIYIYRQRSGSISWGQREKSASSLLVCLINICSYWMTNDFSSEENKYISEYVRSVYISYLNRKGYQNSADIMGQEKEKLIQKIITTTSIGEVSFKDEDIKKLKKSKTNIVYGAGKIANNVILFLKENRIDISYVAVTDAASNPKTLYGIPIKAISQLRGYSDAAVVIGTSQIFHEEIANILKEYQFKELVYPVI